MSLKLTANRKATLLAVREGKFHRDGTRGPWYLAENGDRVTGAQTRALNDLYEARLVFTQRLDGRGAFSSARVGMLTQAGLKALTA